MLLCEQHKYQNYCTDIPMCDVSELISDIVVVHAVFDFGKGSNSILILLHNIYIYICLSYR